MPRWPGKLVAIAFGALLLAHFARLAAGFGGDWFRADQWSQNLVWLALALGVALLGRLFLSFLPPGPLGAHDPHSLPETAAASLALGWVAVALGSLPLAYLWLLAGDAWPGLPPALSGALLALLAFLRWVTLPGAMVPRHPLERGGFGGARWFLVAVLSAWLAFALFTRAFVPALAWLALGLLLERGLARARRAAGGRALFLLACATLGHPGQELQGELFGLFDELGVGAALALGAAFLIPWLRRADRRAGLLAALFFGALFLAGPDPLAFAGPLVLVLASRREQRRFALLATLSAALVCALLGTWGRGAEPRGRLLLAAELFERARDSSVWGWAWPLALAALALGALSFPWRARPWTPGAIEEPRREALALVALLALACLALALPASRWFESEALVILFPLVALLAGLLLIPPEPGARAS